MHGCDYSSTVYEWRHFVKEESCNLWYTQSCVCVTGLISARALKHRHVLWLSLLFNYVYMGQWRRQFSFLKSCKATYSISCLSSYTECMCVCARLCQGNCGSLNFPTHTEKGFSRPHCHRAKPFYWLPGGLSDARQVMLLCRYSNLPAPITPSPLHPFIVFVHVPVGRVMQQRRKCFLLCD